MYQEEQKTQALLKIEESDECWEEQMNDDKRKADGTLSKILSWNQKS